MNGDTFSRLAAGKDSATDLEDVMKKHADTFVQAMVKDG